MDADAKTIDELSAEDLDRFPIWAFIHDGSGELSVRPVKQTRLRDLSGKLVGTIVTFANGTRRRGLLGNLHLSSARSTQHFLTLSIDVGGAWFHLARYHDFDFNDRGPNALAKLVGLDVDDVFPISYDVRVHALDPLGVAAGTIPASPPERLSRQELIALAVPLA